MIIYHGSEQVIHNPSFGTGNISNDYGRGFYCTEHMELAGEWACKRDRDGFINSYELDTSSLSVCDLGSDEYNILNWLALLTRYRGYWQRKSIAEEAKTFLQENYLIDISGFDIIKGYRADDSYFSFVQDFIAGTISLQKLSAAMRFGDLNEQIVPKSELAFKHISFINYEVADAGTYYHKKTKRDLDARKQYRDLRPSAGALDEIYIIDIMRGAKDGTLRI